MLTGDADAVAQQVAGELGIDQVYSQLLPADKVSRVEQLLNEKPAKKKLAFVGDGINDAPVLSRADIGIAMGAMGSDAAIEAADVVLMDDDPLKIAKAIKISRKCLGIVYQNIVFALAIKGICLVLGALGIANMWLAIFADVGVMILAVLNAIRALFVKKLCKKSVWSTWFLLKAMNASARIIVESFRRRFISAADLWSEEAGVSWIKIEFIKSKNNSTAFYTAIKKPTSSFGMLVT